MKIPKIFQKPNHKKLVVATPAGWVVEETGEVLVSVKNLDVKLSEFLGQELVLPIQDIVEEIITEEKLEESVEETEEKVEVVEVIENLEESVDESNDDEFEELLESIKEAEADQAEKETAEEKVEAVVADKPKKRGRPAKAK